MWLEDNSLNHAAIVLLGMYPVIKFNDLIGGNAWTAALMWIVAYYGREVTSAQRFSHDWGALWPGNWRTRHDRIQTLYLVITAVAWAMLYDW